MALRTPLSAQPHLYIGDSTGRPLDYGRVYFGEPNKDPEFYPIDIYLDPEMTIAAAQPVRTKGGFMDVGGNLAELHAAEVIYSLKVLDRFGRQVFYKPEMYRNNVSDFLVDEITRATTAETLIAGNLTTETQRAIAAEKVIADAVVTEKDRAIAAEVALDVKHAALSSTINSLGGGKKAYTTYALMVADKNNIPANSSIDVTNDTDPLKNGTYSYDGAVFAKSIYDVETIVRTKVLNTFKTKSLMDASALPDGADAQVTDDTVNNGLYVKTAGTWVKSAYDPLNTAKAHTDSAINSISKTILGKNLYNKNNDDANKYIDATGQIRPATGWSISDYIPITEGQKYTISATDRRLGLAFFSDKSVNAISGSYNGTAYTVKATAPTGAKYLVINVNSTTVTASNVQVETGDTQTAYTPYTESKEVLKNVLPSDVVYNDELQAALSGIDIKKDYEIDILSKNLFDKSKIIQKQYVDNEGALVKSDTLTGWSTSHLIPVVAGETYTLSGIRGRLGISFFASEDTSTPLQYVNYAAMPLTVTAPEGAKFVMFNITQPTDLTATNLQFEKGAVASSYVEYSSFVGIDSSFIVDNNVNDNPLAFSNFAILGSNSARITANNDIELQLDLLLTKPNTRDNSTVFNFTGDTVNGTLLRALNDDVAPLRIDGTTVGANHGYIKTVTTSVGHGKTNADVGSVWTDGVAQFIIIDIVSADKLSVTARTSNAELTANSLTHVSGAANTASINSTTKTTNQWYPAIKNRKLTVFVDGARIDASAIRNYNYSDSVALHETYEIMSKSDIVEWLILNGGVARTNYDAEPSVLYNNSYVFDKEGGCVIYTSATAYKSIPFQDYMGTQSVPFTSTTNRSFYVPKTVPFTQDSKTYDFTALQPMTAPVATSLLFNAAKNGVGENPVDRLIQFTDGVGYATGYLPLLDAEPSKRVTNASNKYLEVRNGSLKTYPSLIDGLKTMLAAGDTFAGIAYRKYFKRDAARTAKYVVRSNIADFLYLDWHSAKTDVIELPEDLVGRAFTVHEESSNVTLLSAFATNNIAVKIDNSKSYGYLVLRFDK